jgi:uncharacterized protein
MRSIGLASIAPQTWRNGGGRTRELLCWPSAEDWSLRISVADIETDGPFSSFPGVKRWFAVIEGAGVVLSFPDVERQLVPGDAPLHFAGVPAPDCRLLKGATHDLNLMTRFDQNASGQSTMCQAQSGVAWNEPFAMRGLYAAVDGHWSCGNEHGDVLANSLLWSDAKTSAAWHFEPANTNAIVSGWWLGFTPQ